MPGALPVLLAAPLDQRGTQPDARFAKSWLMHRRDEVWAPKIILNRAREIEKIGFVSKPHRRCSSRGHRGARIALRDNMTSAEHAQVGDVFDATGRALAWCVDVKADDYVPCKIERTQRHPRTCRQPTLREMSRIVGAVVDC
jgi:hypothetical protein